MNFSKVALLFVCLFSIQSAIAGVGVDPATKFAYNVRVLKGTQKVKLAFQNEAKQKVVIKIYDETHNLVFSEIQKDTEKMSKSYDLSALGNGNYTIKIESGDFIVEEKLVVNNKREEVESLPVEVVVAPYQFKENSFVLSYSNAGEKTVYLTIKDDVTGNKVYSTALNGFHNYNQLFVLNQLPKGKYTVVASTGGLDTTRVIEVK